MIPLRPYQSRAKDAARARIAAGIRRLLVVAPTGAGKTVLFASIVQSAVERGTHVLVLAHRRELVKQPWCRFLRAGIDPTQVGVVLAGVPSGPASTLLGPLSDLDDEVLWQRLARRRPDAMVQVASIDSIRNRAKPPAGLIIVDEAHRVLSAGYMKLAEEYPSATFVGLTATPLRADNKPLGNFFEDMVIVATYRDLIKEGFLVEPRVFTVPAAELPDLARVRIKGGDYDAAELSNACDTPGLVGDVVSHWQRHGNDAPTFCFAVSVEHSRHLAARFVEAGVQAKHVDAQTPMAERDAAFRDLRSGALKVLCNVDVATEGVDVVQVKTVVLARPTKSLRIYAQQVGRGSRPCDSGLPFTVLDHAGSALNFGLPHMIEWAPEILHNTKDRKGVSSAPCKSCPQCFCVCPASAKVCPDCGAEFQSKPRAGVEEQDGELVEVVAPSEADVAASWSALRDECIAKGYRPAWMVMRWGEMYPGTKPPADLPSEDECAGARSEQARVLDGYVAQAVERGYTCHWIKASFKARCGRWPSNDLFAKTRLAEVINGAVAGLRAIVKLAESGRARPSEPVRVQPANDLVEYEVA